MEKKQNILITLLIIIIVLLVALVALLVYDKISTKDVDSDISQNDDTIIDETTQDEEDEIDNDSLIPDNTDNSSDEETETPSKPVPSKPNEITGKSSSKENPLSFGEWGLVAKYLSGDYIDTPARVTNITRGATAAQEVKTYLDSGSSIYKYTEPKEAMEWAVVEYEVDLTNFEKTTAPTLSARIIGTGDSNAVKYNGKSYIIPSTIKMTSNDYIKGEIVKCKFAVQLPIGCTDYIITLGTSDSTQAFFAGK